MKISASCNGGKFMLNVSAGDSSIALSMPRERLDVLVEVLELVIFRGHGAINWSLIPMEPVEAIVSLNPEMAGPLLAAIREALAEADRPSPQLGLFS